MHYLIDIIKGALIGVANIIPGVSGGTMAVSLGIYDRLIYALTDFFKNWKKSVRTLLPIVIGLALGIVGFAYAVEFLLRTYALPTVLAFLGLVLGGVPMLWRSLRESGERITAVNVVVFLLLLAVSAGLPLLNPSETGAALGSGPVAYIVLFFVGIVASATMVIPGVSGSMVLMILGYYYGVIGALKSFFDALRALDMSLALRLSVPLIFFGVGVLAGIFLVAKAIRFLFERQAANTYSGILGLVAGAPVAMFYNTGALDDLALPSGVLRLVVGVVLAAACFFAVYLPGRGGKSH